MEMVNFKKIFGLLLEMGNVGDKIGRDGNWGHLSLLFDEGVGLSTVKWDMLGRELATGDREDLKKFVEAKFDIKDDDLEVFIEKALSFIIDSYQFFKLTLGYFKKDEK